MSDETLATRQNLEQQIISHAWKDADFRQELVDNPREAIKREFGLLLPEGMQIVVHQETSSTVHLVLPVNPVEHGVTELSDEELAGVAGGASWLDPQPASVASNACTGGVRG